MGKIKLLFIEIQEFFLAKLKLFSTADFDIYFPLHLCMTKIDKILQSFLFAPILFQTIKVAGEYVVEKSTICLMVSKAIPTFS